jgi:hypothetical protein
LEAFKNLKEIKIILDLSRYASSTQKPRRLIVGTAALWNAAGVAGKDFDPGWQLDLRARQALGFNYAKASEYCRELEYKLEEREYGDEFFKLQQDMPTRWGMTENGLKLMEKHIWEALCPQPYLGSTRKIRIRIVQWQRPEELMYQHQNLESGKSNY